MSEDKITEDNKNKKYKAFKIIRILCLIGFIVFTGLFINEVLIQPYRIKKSVDFTRDIYHKPTKAPIPTQITPIVTPAPVVVEATPSPDPNRDDQGRLLQFKELLETNGDVKGWITIPDTNIDYVVVQSSKEEPDYYLDKDINKEYSKAGTLYLDIRSSIEDQTKNYVIHGHNMVSTSEKMFHKLLDYKEMDFYKERPTFTFDTIYETGEWKIISVFITTGDASEEDFFDYRASSFESSSDFLNFVYQIRIRSVLNLDTVDLNENDQIITLSTCSYEVDNYRTVVVARKVRKGEASSVNVEQVSVNENALYPSSYYYRVGGKAPQLAKTFEEALENGEISWYTPTE